MAGRRGSGLRRAIVTLVVLGTLGAGLEPVAAAPLQQPDEPEQAEWWEDITPSTPEDDPVVPPPEPEVSAPPIESVPLEVDDRAARLPEPGVAELTLSGPGVARRVGGLPVALAAASRDSRGQAVRVEVLDHQVAARAGVSGFVMRVTGAGGAALAAPESGALPVTLSIDYSGFRDLYGAGYADRLRVVALRECALASPVPAGCDRSPTRLPSRNEAAEQRLLVDIRDLTDVQVLAVTSQPEGPEGTFKATPLAISGDWQVGVGSGEFTWKYDLPVREAPAGPTPDMSLSYSSGLVDSLVTSRNTQGGPMGIGWSDFGDSFIERRYNSCLDDGRTFADLCWKSDNATISLNGRTSEMVPVNPPSNTQWVLKSDPRWRVERFTGANNGDDNGEHWRVTTPDGVQYLFGLGLNPDGLRPTNSTWTVPVVGDDAGEPCNPQPLNMCARQAWRWNLDRTVDTNGNTAHRLYSKETNNYLSQRSGQVTAYDMGGTLAKSYWGTSVGLDNPAVVLDFFTGWRCSTLDVPTPCPQPGPGVTATYPDVPVDLYCGGSCSITSPTFFTARRYKSVQIQVRMPLLTLVNTVAFSHEFQNPDPSTTDDAKLFLNGIQRTGHHPDTGATLSLPPTTFTGVTLNNRVDTAGGTLSAMPHWRIGSVKDEFGRQVDVTYGQPHPCPNPIPNPPNWDLNTRNCFPQQFTPEGGTPGFGVFNKYLVTQVQVRDTTGGSPTMVTNYAYGSQVASGLPNGAWHHDRDEFVPLANQTWSEWRGYQDVQVTQGASRTRYRLFRGMNRDRLAGDPFPGPGSRTATVSSLDGTVVNVPDENWLAGRTLDEMSLRSDGTAERGVVHGYQSVVRVDAPGSDLLDDARWVAENDMVERFRTPAAGQVFARQRTQTVYNGFFLNPERVIEHGWTNQTGDERCTATTYVFNIGAFMIDYPSSVTRYATTTCTGAEVTRAETAYDGGAVGAGPTNPGGNPTLSRTKITATPVTWATTTRTFDSLGRPRVVTDPNGHTTTTTYNPTAGHPDTVTVTNHLGHAEATGLNEAWGTPATVTDPNGKITTYTYDPLGRVTEVRQPTEATGPASWLFSYDIDPERDEVPVINTRQLQDTAGSGGAARYLSTWVVYDSLLRERQTHTISPVSGTNPPPTIVSDTTYDNRGLVAVTNLPQAVTGAPGVRILAAPTGGWANRNETTYDHLARPTRQDSVNSAGLYRRTNTTYTHDSADSTPVTASGQPAGTRTRTVTDAYERTIRVEEHDGTAFRPTVYTYDAADRLLTVTDPASNRITYGYDMAGRRISMDDPDAGDWTYGYDTAGNQTSVRDAAGVVVHTIYDELNRPKERRQNSVTGPLLASWTYDATNERGLLNSSTRHHSSGQWVVDVTGYDARNRPTGRSWTVPAGIAGLSGTYAVSYGYDAADHQTRMTYPAVGGLASETITTVYSSVGLPETMAAGATEYVYASAYDDRGRPFLFGFGSSVTQPWGKFWSYDNNQRLSVMQAAASGTVVQNRTILYEAAGNVTERNTTLAGASARECFGYDRRQRLTSAFTTSGTCATGTRGTGANPYNHTYTYSHDGNLTSRVEGSTTISYSYPAGGVGSTRPHAPTAVGGNNYIWDTNGNLDTRVVGGQTEDLVWDPEHRLASIDDPDGDSSFVYDADGTRLLRQSPTGKTLYIEGHEVTVPTTGSATAVRSYTYGGSLIATRTPAGLDFLATDNQGSVELSVPSGATAPDVARTYFPYGRRRTGGQPDTDHTWIGQIEDDATNLHYLNARYYDPTTAVFISADPVYDPARPQTLNPFNYGISNPTSTSDPTGLDPPCYHLPTSPCSTVQKAAQISAATGGTVSAATVQDYIESSCCVTPVQDNRPRLWINTGAPDLGTDIETYPLPPDLPCRYVNTFGDSIILQCVGELAGLLDGPSDGGNGVPQGCVSTGELSFSCPVPEWLAGPRIDAAEGGGETTEGGQTEGGDKPETVTKQTSPVWQATQSWRGGTRTNGESGSKRRYYEWDYTHNDIEVYDRTGRHLGSIDPKTGQQTKDPVPGRTINVS